MRTYKKRTLQHWPSDEPGGPWIVLVERSPEAGEQCVWVTVKELAKLAKKYMAPVETR